MRFLEVYVTVPEPVPCFKLFDAAAFADVPGAVRFDGSW
jgi:hypothetical protein